MVAEGIRRRSQFNGAMGQPGRERAPELDDPHAGAPCTQARGRTARPVGRRRARAKKVEARTGAAERIPRRVAHPSNLACADRPSKILHEPSAGLASGDPNSSHALWRIGPYAKIALAAFVNPNSTARLQAAAAD